MLYQVEGNRLWTIIGRRLKRNKRGASTIIAVVLSLVIIVVIVSNVVLWSYEMNQLDWERMNEDVDITGVARVTNSSWSTVQSEYTVNIGSRISGTYTDTQAVDGNYEGFRETLGLSYNPSGYILGGSTSWVSGSVSNLTSDDGVYMTFRSYSSSSVSYTKNATYFTEPPFTFTNPENAYASDDAYAQSPNPNFEIYYGGFGTESGNITSVVVKYELYTTGFSDDTWLLQHSIDGTTWVVDRPASSNNVAEQTFSYNITSERAWTWADISNLRLDIKGTKTAGPESAYVYVDWVGVYVECNEYALEVEFTGSSGTGVWDQLSWSVDSAWTIGSISVTLQLYNYSLGDYPTSGNGYMSYTSSAIANTDETKNQTVTTNPTHFRNNTTGNWKMKVKGVKATDIQFDFKADWMEFRSGGSSRLDMNSTFTLDLSTYPLDYIQTVEIQLKYRANDTGENLFLKAYNWTAAAYSDSGFNNTAGHTPTTGLDTYAVNLTEKWRSYVSDSGTMYVKLQDNQADANQTTIDIDFLGVRVKIDGTRLTFKNEGSVTLHLVSLWVINSTSHQHYDIDVIVNSAETYSYIRADISLPSGSYTVKVVTERGNKAMYTYPQ